MPRARQQRDHLTGAPLNGAPVRACGLCAGYGPRTILKGLDFALPPNRITVVLGPGGSGKSTLLQALSPCPDSRADLWMKGEREVRGAVSLMPQHVRWRIGTLGSMLQEATSPALAPELVLREAWRAVPEAFEALAPRLDVPFEELAFCEARLAQLTVAVVRKPLLLLDEPDARLDEEQQSWVARRLIDLRGTRTVVLTTHHLKIARLLADFVLLLIDGELLECGNAEDVLERSTEPRTVHFLKMGS